ncbi:MAG: hypothetical protein OXI30_14470 [Chloroflexota bacterium]|nr:hypothetical protein [Chloroflexota bacterium]
MKTRRKSIVLYTLLAFSSLIVYLPVMYHASRFHSDFGSHIERALKMPHDLDHVSSPLFHAVFLLVFRFADLAPRDAAFIAILLAMVPVPLIAFAVFSRCAGEHLPDSVLMAVAFGLAIMSPISIWTNPHLLGYLNSIVYHNPTSITVRLFVIPVSILAFRSFQYQPYRSLNHRVYELLLSAVMVSLMNLAKPSLALALLPGCCLFAIWRYLRRGSVDWARLVVGIMLPAILMLGLFALISYVDFDDGSAIEIGFLTFMTQHVPAWRIPIQFMLSIVFPVGVCLLYAKQASRNHFLIFAWTVFACAILVTYGLFESGPRFLHGNFLWTSYGAVFLLMFASTQFLLEQYVRELQFPHSDFRIFGLRFSRRFAFATVLFGLHVISGIGYGLRFLTYELF